MHAQRGARVRQYRTSWYGSHVSVYVSREAFAVLYSARRRHVYKGFLLPFLSATADDQRLEVARAIWKEQEVKRRDPSTVPGLASHASPAGLVEQFPNLAEFMTCAVYDDNARRESPTVTIWAQAGQWKASVKDRAEALVMWLSAEKLPELLQMLELFVLEAEAPWRVDEYGSDQKGKRVKK